MDRSQWLEKLGTKVTIELEAVCDQQIKWENEHGPEHGYRGIDEIISHPRKGVWRYNANAERLLAGDERYRAELIAWDAWAWNEGVRFYQDRDGLWGLRKASKEEREAKEREERMVSRWRKEESYCD